MMDSFSKSFWHLIDAYRVLVAIAGPWKSHHQFGIELVKALLADNHEVTMITPHKHPEPLSNYEEVFIEFDFDEVQRCDKAIFDAYRSSFKIFMLLNEILTFPNLIRSTFKKSKGFQRLLNSNKQFDVILGESISCVELVGLGHHFNAPIITFSTSYESPELLGLAATPNLKSFTSLSTNSFTDKMNFWQRLENQIIYSVGCFIFTSMKAWAEQRGFESMFPNMKDPPSLLDLQRNVSMIFLNSHPALQAPRPLLPHVIEVGGLAVLSQYVQPLPDDLQLLLDEAKSGAIYFSFGSIVPFSWISSEILKSLLSAFREFKHIQFLVKSSEEFIALTQEIPNVLVRSWFPQKAILKHPNVKCFISHAGHNSIKESISYVKPMITIPFVNDQLQNSRWAHEKGYGIEITQEKITPTILKLAIQTILSNSSYLHQAQVFSKRFWDRPLSPKETAVFWINYVASTKGAPLFKTSVTHYSVLLYYNLDVWLLFIVVLSMVSFILWKSLRRTYLHFKSRYTHYKLKLH